MTISHRLSLTSGMLVACLLVTLPSGRVRAWDTLGYTDPGLSGHANLAHVFDGYSPAAHFYIVQHAVELLRADGYPNWARVAEDHLVFLLEGSRWADERHGTAVIRITLKLWSFITLESWSARFCRGGMGHYYNPSTGKGLTLDMERFLEQLVRFAGVGLGVIAATWTMAELGLPVWLDPHVELPAGWNWGPYPSALAGADSAFQEAVANLAGSTSDACGGHCAGLAPLQRAAFNLGHALHLAADLSVTHHTHDAYLQNHQEYESAADGKGDGPGTSKLHAHTAAPYTPGAQITDIVEPVALRAHKQSEFDAVAAGRFEAGLQRALPDAEQATARILYRFLAATGIDPVNGTVRGQVEAMAPDGGKQPLPGAYVFYRRRGASGAWQWTRADDQGRYVVSTAAGPVLFRPAHPRYVYRGRYNLSTDDDVVAAVRRASPVEVDVGGVSPPILYLYLEREPQVVDPAAMARLAGPRPMTVAPGALTGPRGVLTALPERLQTGMQQGLVSAQALPRFPLLGAYASGLGLPETSMISVQVRRLVDGGTGAALSQRAAVAQRAAGVASGQPRFTEAAWPIVTMALPRRPIIGAAGSRHWTPILPADALGTPADPMAFAAHGLLAVPALSGTRVRARFVGGADLIAGGPERIFETDERGMVDLVVAAGHRAGDLIVELSPVVTGPDVVEGAVRVHFFVQPALQGMDAEPGRPPTLELAKVVLARPPEIRYEAYSNVGPPASRHFEKSAQLIVQELGLPPATPRLAGTTWRTERGAVLRVVEQDGELRWLDARGHETLRTRFDRGAIEIEVATPGRDRRKGRAALLTTGGHTRLHLDDGTTLTRVETSPR